MASAAGDSTRANARSRVEKTRSSQQVTAGVASVPPVFALELIRRALRNSELSITLQPPSPYSRDVLALIDEARSAIRAIEQAADRIAALRMSGGDIDQLVHELLDLLGAPS
jgi:hypothetical protein